MTLKYWVCKKWWVALPLVCSVSCGSYIAQWHRLIDQAKGAPSSASWGPWAKAKAVGDGGSKGRQLVSGQGRKYSMANVSNLRPRVQRQYQRPQRKRSTVGNLYGHGNEGSLWPEGSQGGYLFASNRVKKNGDIVVIDVGEKLRQNIMQTLAMNFPQMMEKKQSGQVRPKGSAPDQGKKADRAVYDRISSVVIEEISQQYLLVRGRKDVVYRGRRRPIEIQAMVARRDIGDMDRIHSDYILDSRILVSR